MEKNQDKTFNPELYATFSLSQKNDQLVHCEVKTAENMITAAYAIVCNCNANTLTMKIVNSNKFASKLQFATTPTYRAGDEAIFYIDCTLENVDEVSNEEYEVASLPPNLSELTGKIMDIHIHREHSFVLDVMCKSRVVG